MNKLSLLEIATYPRLYKTHRYCTQRKNLVQFLLSVLVKVLVVAILAPIRTNLLCSLSFRLELVTKQPVVGNYKMAADFPISKNGR